MGFRVQFDSKVFNGTQSMATVILVYKDDNMAVPVITKNYTDCLTEVMPNQYHALLVGYRYVLDTIKTNNLKNVTIEHHNEVFLKWAKTLECPSDYHFLVSGLLDKYLAVENHNVLLKKIDVKSNNAKKHLSKIKQPVMTVPSDVELYSISDILNKFR